MPAGRPSDYSTELSSEICTRILNGDSLRVICRDPSMPVKGTIFRWLSEIQEFRDRYGKAKELMMEAMGDEILAIADDSSDDHETREREDGTPYTVVNNEAVNRARLRVDTRKWLMSKLAPKKYGDRVVNEHTGKDGGPIATMEVSDADRAKALAAFMAKTRAQSQK